MIVKGIIETVDYVGNSCTIRIPTFETTSNPNGAAIFNASIMSLPGIYNNYQVGDIIFAAFDEGNITYPVVIGKLYLGATKEAGGRGTISCDSLTAVKTASLPITTKLTSGNSLSEQLENSSNSFSTIKDMADLLQSHDASITKINEFNNTEFYSSGEVVIGNWIDNKPIYRKTIIRDHNPAIARGSDFLYFIDISGLSFENIWQDLTHTIQIGDQYSLNSYNAPGQADYFNCYVDAANKRLYVRGNAPDNISKHIITLEYTKK